MPARGGAAERRARARAARIAGLLLAMIRPGCAGEPGARSASRARAAATRAARRHSTDARTLVVVPTFLTSPEALEEQIERLEIHYLANADGELYFALLSDWTDADAEGSPATTRCSPPRARASRA